MLDIPEPAGAVREKHNMGTHVSDQEQPRELSLPEMVFVSTYLSNGENAADAYRVALQYNGPQATSLASLMKNRPHVKAAIEAAKAAIAEKLMVTPERILGELARIGFSDPRETVTWTENNVKLRASDEITNDAAASISSISMTKHGPKITYHDKHSALINLGKHLGMFKEKVEHSVDESLSALIEASFHKPPAIEAPTIDVTPIDRQAEEAVTIPAPPPPPPPPPPPKDEN